MDKILKCYFPDPNASKSLLQKTLGITDFVVEFYKKYLFSRVAVYGYAFPEACYPLFFSLNFHLLRSYVDSVDRKLYTPQQKQEASHYSKNFAREINRIENKTVPEIEAIIQNYVNSVQSGLSGKKIAKTEIAVDFGVIFIKCCDELIEKFGTDSMGMMSPAFIESAIFCISLFVLNKTVEEKIYKICLETQREITLAIEEYNKNKIKMDILEN